MKRFESWMLEQIDRNDPIGDLANDMKRDPSVDFRQTKSLRQWRVHLLAHGGCDEAHEALIEAWREWQQAGNTFRETRPASWRGVTANGRTGIQELTRVPLASVRGWYTLRFQVLKRDGYRCQLCGATAADGARLEVDHKVPRARGGTDDESNLWVLCLPCNRGKRDKAL